MIIESITSEEAEDIAYKTAFLLNKGWKRISKYNIEDNQYDKYITTDYVWTKDLETQTISVHRYEDYDYPTLQVTVKWFSLNEAYDRETL